MYVYNYSIYIYVCISPIIRTYIHTYIHTLLLIFFIQDPGHNKLKRSHNHSASLRRRGNQASGVLCCWARSENLHQACTCSRLGTTDPKASTPRVWHLSPKDTCATFRIHPKRKFTSPPRMFHSQPKPPCRSLPAVGSIHLCSMGRTLVARWHRNRVMQCNPQPQASEVP